MAVANMSLNDYGEINPFDFSFFWIQHFTSSTKPGSNGK
jgi:hypothetical protein